MKGQRGAALLTALLIVSLAVIIATSLLSRQTLDVRRTANILDRQQALWYLSGLESWVKVILREDADDNSVDHLEEPWRQQLPPIPVDGGFLQGELQDLNNCFNLNNLLDDQGQVQNNEVAALGRLLEVFEINTDVSAAVADWIDADEVPRFPGGAEDITYLDEELPYRTSNRLFESVSELRLIGQIDETQWQALLPHICVLPERSRLNINTATPEVLLSLDAGLNDGDVSTLVDDRGSQGYDSVADFLAHPALAGRAIPAERLSVSSRFFLLNAQIALGRGQVQAVTKIRRDNGEIRVIYRSFGER